MEDFELPKVLGHPIVLHDTENPSDILWENL